VLWVDRHYIETLGLEVIKGRDFSSDHSIDAGGSIILNESAVNFLNLTSPIGTHYQAFAGMDDNAKPWYEGTVVGVIKDFHYRNLHTRLQPLMLISDPRRCDFMLIRTSPENYIETIATMERTWKKLIPERPFEYSFINDEIDVAYSSEKRFTALLKHSTLLAVLISCIGLFGLASFSAKQRTKEIGIRKVLGATIANLVALLSKEYLLLVIAANIIACPTAYYLMNHWLQNFTYRINISWDLFALAALLAFMIALATVSYHAIKAALANPVDSLRYE
jgi:putative ABC transport system permease protein